MNVNKCSAVVRDFDNGGDWRGWGRGHMRMLYFLLNFAVNGKIAF